MIHVATLPPGYDARSCLALRDDNRLVVTHPEHPPLVLSASGEWVEISTGFVHPAQKRSD